jgi:uncharacterized protein (TIGR00730 family)
MKRICVFCGSSAGSSAVYSDAARSMGEEIARRGLELVYGGGQVGLMGVLADAALGAGGRVIGVIPESLALKEVAHTGLTEQRVVTSMHERKATMAELADAFIALPGGFGTFEEFCEIVTWAQLGTHCKPCGLLNVDAFYDPLLSLFDHAVAHGFIRPEHRRIVMVATTVDGMLDSMERWDPTTMGSATKWMDRTES